MRSIVKLNAFFVRLEAVVEESHLKEPLTIIKITSNKKQWALHIFEKDFGILYKNSKTSRIKYKRAAKTGAVQ